MIGLYDDAGARLAVFLPDVTLNNPADDTLDTFEINNVSTVAQFDQAVDSSPAGDGAIFSPARRVLYVVRLDGTIRAPTQAKLYDKKVLLSMALDPSLAVLKNPTTSGFVDMSFSVPTTDTTEYPSGLVASRYRVRSRGAAVPLDSMYQGTSSFFSIELFLKDPRRVSQTPESLSGAGTANNKGNAPADVVTTIVMSGSGEVNFTSSNNGPYSAPEDLVLNLSGLSNGNVVVVDHAARTITVNGADASSRYVSGPFWDLEPGNNAVSYGSTTNTSSRSIAWRRSWVA